MELEKTLQEDRARRLVLVRGRLPAHREAHVVGGPLGLLGRGQPTVVLRKRGKVARHAVPGVEYYARGI